MTVWRSAVALAALPLLLHAQDRSPAIVLNHVAIIDATRAAVLRDMTLVIRGARSRRSDPPALWRRRAARR